MVVKLNFVNYNDYSTTQEDESNVKGRLLIWCIKRKVNAKGPNLQMLHKFNV